MSKADIIYRDTCREIIDNGFSDENLDVRPHWEDGTPAHTKKKFGVVNRYNLAEEFPLMTLRRTYWKSAIDEMLWIWQKKSNRVAELSSHVWDQWADENGTIGSSYGYQIGKPYIHHTIKNAGTRPLNDLEDLSAYPSAYIEYDAEKDVANVWMDQIDGVLWDLRNNRASRRIMTNIYNFQDLHAMSLYPCAYSMTFNVTGDTLNGILNQRSQDMLAANNWNVVQYAALMMMIAKATGLKVGELVHVIADCHIYDRHIPLVEKMLENEPLPAPKMFLDTDETDFYKITKDDFRVEDYSFHPFNEKIEIAI